MSLGKPVLKLLSAAFVLIGLVSISAACSSSADTVDVSPTDGPSETAFATSGLSPDEQVEVDAELAARKSQLQEGQALPVGRSRTEGFDIENIVFPGVELAPTVTLDVPDGPLPDASAMVFLRKGPGDNVFSFDTVKFTYEMYEWSTGARVDEAALESRLVDALVPLALRDALIGVPVGSVLGVIYEFEMPDLPDGFNQSDAHYVIVQVNEITAMAG